MQNKIKNCLAELASGNSVNLANMFDGAIAWLVAELLNNSNNDIIFLANDSQRIVELEACFSFFAPQVELIHLPAWDCLPYDRVSPSGEVQAKRLFALTELAKEKNKNNRRLIMLTPACLLQKVPTKNNLLKHVCNFSAGQICNREKLIDWLNWQGFIRVSNVRQSGEYAVRGSILDLFAPGYKNPVRLDYFGEKLESIRTFDASSQLTKSQLKNLNLLPMSEVSLDAETISCFRNNYLSMFGVAKNDDQFYFNISQKQRHPGLEHYLPLFYKTLENLFDYFGKATMFIDHLAMPALHSYHAQICEHFNERKQDTTYKTLAWQKLYLAPDFALKNLQQRSCCYLSPFTTNDESFDNDKKNISFDISRGKNYTLTKQSNLHLFENLNNDIKNFQNKKIHICIACWSEGSRQRLWQIFKDNNIENLEKISCMQELFSMPKTQIAMAVLKLESSFVASNFAIISEQDILGDRLSKKRPTRKSSDVLFELSSLSQGDFVVHAEHGIGRFVGLQTIKVGDVLHDCLDLRYHNDDKLFLPVENIELLSKLGSAQSTAMVDRLGSGHWQARKARAKKHILAIAKQLIELAAARKMKKTAAINISDIAYNEFAARFPYDETPDQSQAIEAVLGDLNSQKPMDRLVCGDVGFGKTEIALRAACAAVLSKKQVAIIVPTTLLARQHYETFKDRFKNLDVKISQLSRLVPQSMQTKIKEKIKLGEIDIAIGTHALLGSAIQFKNLALLVIDEEQHFGVTHKEKLKHLKQDVHVLTLSATPIPRTLQLALTGIKELSLISTPPIDRMAVRTFVAPFDKVTIRQALLREKYRGGRSFYVCPRISDLKGRVEFLQKYVPELKIAVAHAKLPANELENIMLDFYEGKYDVLLSTTIIESGLDIKDANTLIVHRADRFGLSQLYQLRGRVGRGKIRAYAFLTLAVDKPITTNAEKRLKLLSTLDTLGAGFQLASHDLDIRGAGNILGQEQSGHIKEVGYELYQQMLEAAIAELKDGEVVENNWSPQLGLGLNVMIPKKYVEDLDLRMNLYRRLADLQTKEQTDLFATELVDRFGAPMPTEIEHLLHIVLIKAKCKKANIERLDAGSKGIVLHFRNKKFANVDGLLAWIKQQGKKAQVRHDQSIVLSGDFSNAQKRLGGVEKIVNQLANMVK